MCVCYLFFDILERLSSIMFNRSGGIRLACLLPDNRVKTLNLAPLNMMLRGGRGEINSDGWRFDLGW